MIINGLHTCPKCGETDGTKFNKDRSKKNGLCSYCRECSNKKSNQYYSDKKDIINTDKRERYSTDKYYNSRVKKQTKKSRKQHGKYWNANRREKYHTNPESRNKKLLSNNLYVKNNPEKVRQIKQQEYERNKPYYQSKNRQYYEDHAEECLVRNRQWKKDHPEKDVEYKYRWYENNKELVKVRNHAYYLANKEEIYEKKLKRHKERLDNDINYRLARNLRKRLHAGLTKHLARNPTNPRIKVGSAIADLGCSVSELKSHLESKFYSHPATGQAMLWDQWGNGQGTWQIDHIREIHTFDLSNRKEFLEACHYTNLQPLWHEDHVSKSSY